VSSTNRSSASNRIIYAKDHASIGLALAELDEQGHVTGTTKTIDICGEIRRMGESDDSINRLSREIGLSKGI
jgi:small subunit ribosomal protein S21e